MKGQAKKQVAQREMFEQVMRLVVSKGYKKYKPTAKWLNRKFRARAYYGIIFTEDFCKAYFGIKYNQHRQAMVVSASPLAYLLEHK